MLPADPVVRNTHPEYQTDLSFLHVDDMVGDNMVPSSEVAHRSEMRL